MKNVVIVNPIAKALRLGICRPKVVRPRKGRGSFSRKHLDRERDSL